MGTLPSWNMPKGDLKYLEGGRKSSDEEIRAGLRHLNEKEKLEAMKQIIGLMSMGKDTSDLFPDVVMNVVCTSLELKKLVYTYVLRYAEEKSDIALLSINTFQKDMEHTNQLIRALALRVMSGIRVPVINQLVLLAIKKAASDPSPYVRKTAAYAIPKLYRMDPERLPELLDILQMLLNDRMVLVLSGAVATFNEICPSDLELLHPFYRKLCHMLVDMDEWGQTILLNLLLRYARTQFLNPVKPKKPEKPEVPGKKKKKKEKSFYSDDDSDRDPDDSDDEFGFQMDEDHRLLLKCAAPLLQSRNSGVVMGVAALYWHLADEADSSKVARPLVRLLRGHREVQFAVLSNIATWCCTRATLFRPYLFDFLVKGDDGRMQRELKLEILVHIVDQDNISTVLKEFQSYVKHPDKQFVGNTIQALGRCAADMESVADSCLRYLMTLIKSKSDAVVSESIVAIRHLLQHHPKFVRDGVQAMTLHLSKITAPRARASIAWVIGEFIEQVPTFGPDALRILLQRFAEEDLEVKMQTLNLGCKVFLNNRDQTEPFVRYMFDLCKYDLSYDLRDRARLLKAAVIASDNSDVEAIAVPLLKAQKPPPLVASSMKDRQRYCTGSLSQLVNHTAVGYLPLSEFPTVRPDPSVRDAPVNSYGKPNKPKKQKKQKKVKDINELDSFYDDDDDSEKDSDEDSSDEDSDKDSDDSDDSDFSESKKGFYDSVSSTEEESSEEDSEEDRNEDSGRDSVEEGSSDDDSNSGLDRPVKKPVVTQVANDSSDDSSSDESSDEAAVAKPAARKGSTDDLLGGLTMASAGVAGEGSSADLDDLFGMGCTPAPAPAPVASIGNLEDIFGDSDGTSASAGGGLIAPAKSVMNVTTSCSLRII